MAKKLSVAAVLLLVVVPLCAYTCVLLLGVQLGRAVERSPAEDLGVHPVQWLAQKTPDCAAGGVRCTLRGAIDYITKELIWDTNVSPGLRGGGRGVERSSSSSKQQPYGFAMPPPRSVDALPKTKSTATATTPSTRQQRYHNNHTSPRGVISVGPWGGSSGGQPFYMHGASAPRLRSIILYHSGAIHSLACEYNLAGDYYGDGRMMPSRVAGPWGRSYSFGSRGVRAKIELRSGEYITAMEGTTGHFANVPGVVITSLTFRTSFGRTYGPYGSVAAGSSHSFSVPAADGACIVGFWGRSGWLIDAIGVYMKPFCSSSSSSSHMATYKNYSASRRLQGSN